MGQLRDRMDADLRLRGLSKNTRRLYLRCARDFAAYCGRSPAVVGTEASTLARNDPPLLARSGPLGRVSSERAARR